MSPAQRQSPLQGLGHPYRAPARERDELEDDGSEPVDANATRQAGLVGGVFHAIRLVALGLCVWATAWTVSALAVSCWGQVHADAQSKAEVVGAAVVALAAFAAAKLAGRVGDDVWSHRGLGRCRLACALVCLLGPVGLAVGLPALFVLFRPRVTRLFS